MTPNLHKKDYTTKLGQWIIERQLDLTENVVMVIGCFPFIHLDRYEICGGSLCMRCGFDILMISFPFGGATMAEEGFKRKLAAILSADVKGYKFTIASPHKDSSNTDKLLNLLHKSRLH